MKHRPTTLLLALAAVSLLAIPGCDQQSPEGSSTPGLVPSVNTYEVNGVITVMPDASGRMYINHEPIPTFVSMEGEVVGMNAMTMPFPVAEGVSLAGLAVGDPVRFTFETTWAHEGSGYEILSIAAAPDYVPAETADADDHAGHDHDDHTGHNHGPHDPHGHHHEDHADHTGTVHDHGHE